MPAGRYSDQYILEFYKQKLKSKLCQNQGFVLDGFPKTHEQAKQLFAREYGIHTHTHTLAYYHNLSVLQ